MKKMRKLFAKLCGHSTMTREQSLKIISAHFKNIFDTKKYKKIICTGQASVENIRKNIEEILSDINKETKVACLVDDFSDNTLIELLICDNPLKTPDAINASKDCDAVILFEQAYKSKYSSVDDEMDLFKELTKEVIGFVLLNDNQIK